MYSPSSTRYQSGLSFRRCGRSGVRLPLISLGFWHNFGDVDPFSRSLEIAQYAFDQGIVHFDLANNYGPSYGSAEETFGRIMQKSLAPYRDELFISTKAGYDMWPGPYGEWGSRKYLMASLDQSLRRMNLDYVDVFYSHRFDPETPLEETLQALVDIVRSGKALYAGISRYPLEKAAFAYRYLRDRDVPCLVYQGCYNLLDQEPETAGILNQAYENGVGFTSFSPLAQGLLTDRYLNGIPADSRMSRQASLHSEDLTPQLLDYLNRLNTMAAERDETLAEMALAWILRTDVVTSALIGASKPEQVKENAAALAHAEFSEAELSEIDAILADK